ncbi:hypothetical protein WUBG_06074 [Wuchereria bancrofti]|uniref:Uncharacterized protein n=1 Tax=Wuchereria bancrofti TaxID=6293 RepID=J9F0N5_WUCBA|nr:hypothetical protein WUBG_06074 [Wuchereria bancrofti]
MATDEQMKKQCIIEHIVSEAERAKDGAIPLRGEEQALAMTTVTVRGVSIRDGEMKGADGSTFLGVTIATALLSLPVII